jgi:hypothetical protein
MAKFNPFAEEEAETTATEASAVADTPSAPKDPFAAPDAPPAAPEAAAPATPKIDQYAIVHHPVNGYGIVLAAGELEGDRNAVVVGWFPTVSHPITTDQLVAVQSS